MRIRRKPSVSSERCQTRKNDEDLKPTADIRDVPARRPGLARPRPPSFSLLDGIPLLNPIRIEIVRQNQDAQICETHIAHGHERRLKIGTMRQRAASAVQNYVRRFGNGLRPTL